MKLSEYPLVLVNTWGNVIVPNEDNLVNISKENQFDHEYYEWDYKTTNIVRQRCNLLYYGTLHRSNHFYFVTLTWDDKYTPDQRSQALEMYLESMRKKICVNYVWVQEYHKKSDLQHYHVLMECTISAKAYKRKFVQKHSKNYCGSVNGLDIKSPYSIRGVQKYLTKYLSKNPKGAKYHSRIYGSTQALTKTSVYLPVEYIESNYFLLFKDGRTNIQNYECFEHFNEIL